MPIFKRSESDRLNEINLIIEFLQNDNNLEKLAQETREKTLKEAQIDFSLIDNGEIFINEKESFLNRLNKNLKEIFTSKFNSCSFLLDAVPPMYGRCEIRRQCTLSELDDYIKFYIRKLLYEELIDFKNAEEYYLKLPKEVYSNINRQDIFAMSNIGNILKNKPELSNIPPDALTLLASYFRNKPRNFDYALQTYYLLPKSFSILFNKFSDPFFYYNNFAFRTLQQSENKKLLHLIDEDIYKTNKLFSKMPHSNILQLYVKIYSETSFSDNNEINSQKYINTKNEFEDEEDFLIYNLDKKYKELPQIQRNKVKEVLFGINWNDSISNPVTSIINVLPFIQDTSFFIDFINKAPETQDLLLKNITKSTGIHSGIPSPKRTKEMVDLEKIIIEHFSLNDFSTELQEQYMQLCVKSLKDYENPETIKEMMQNEHELLSNISRYPSFYDLICNNYKDIPNIKNLINKITRHKEGTPEFEEVLQRALISPNLISVDTKNYNDFIDIIEKFPQDPRHFKALSEKSSSTWFSDINQEDIDNVAKILSWFKSDWRRVLTIYSQKEGRDFVDSIHGFGNVLPNKTGASPKGLAQYFFQWSRKADFLTLTEVMGLWNEVKPEDLSKPPRELMIDLMRRVGTFKDAKHPEFYVETIRHQGKIDQDAYNEIENAFSESQTVPLPEWTQNIVVTEKSLNNKVYTGRFLPRSDTRGLHLGEYTNCCQHPGGVGEACAYHGQLSPYGAFFVIEDEKKNILAQSWVWEAKERTQDERGTVYSVCFDNIETKGAQGREELIIRIYEKAAKLMKADTIHIGEGYTKVNLNHLPEASKDAKKDKKQVLIDDESIIDPKINGYWDSDPQTAKPGYLTPVDYGDYSDSEDMQRVLKKNGNVNELPVNAVLTVADDEDDDDTGNEAMVKPLPRDWHIQNPYANPRQAYRALLLARYAEHKGFFRLSDKFTYLAGKIFKEL